MAKSSGGLRIGWLYDDSLDRNDGVAQYVKTLGAWFSSQGHNVSYLVGQSKTTRFAGGEVYSLSKNLRVRWAGNRLTIPAVAKRRLIDEILVQHDFDIVHVQAPYSPLMAKYVISALPATTALVATVHVYPAHAAARFGSKILKRIYGKSFHRVDKWLAVSQAAAAYANEAWKISPAILPNVINLAAYETPAPVRSQNFRIVFLGRLVERKGAAVLIAAVERLIKYKHLQGIELLIAGDGPQYSRLTRQVKKAGLETVVRFLGYVNESAKPRLLASADIACFPSRYGESFGIVLLEAMAAGAGVVIGGDNAGYRSVLADRQELLFKPSAQILADKLEYLINHPAQAKAHHHWQTAFIKHFDVKVVGPELIAEYRRAIAKRRQNSHN